MEILFFDEDFKFRTRPYFHSVLCNVSQPVYNCTLSVSVDSLTDYSEPDV